MSAHTSHQHCAIEGCLTSVDRAESETQQTVIVLVLNKLIANLASGLDGLALGSDAAHGDSILINVTAGTAAITVADVPAGTSDLGGVSRRLVDVVAGLLGLGELLGEDPAELLLVMNLCGELSITYRSAEPVSKSRFRVVPPMLTGVKYSMSLGSGEVTTVP